MSAKGGFLRTKDGDLDLGWMILVVCVVFGCGMFVLEGMAEVKPSTAAWAWFGSFTTLAFINGAAIARARLIAKSDAMGQVAAGIGNARDYDPMDVTPLVFRAIDDPDHG